MKNCKIYVRNEPVAVSRLRMNRFHGLTQNHGDSCDVSFSISSYTFEELFDRAHLCGE
jgi:hypothetical protein